MRAASLAGAAAVLLVGSTGGSAAGAGPSAAGIGVRLLDVPIATAADPRARLYIVDHLHPGAVIHRRIEVSNTTAAKVNVALYASAATISHGEFLGAPGRGVNELSTWTSLRPAASAVSAHGHIAADVTIAVAKDAPPGEQYGVLWVQTRTPAPAGGGIAQVSRVGVRMYLSVGPGGAPRSDFTITSLTPLRSSDGQPELIAAVRNTGGRALDMSGTLRLLDGPGGLSAGPFRANLSTTLAIGDAEPITILLDRRLPAGPWSARVSLSSGLLHRSAQASITFPSARARSSPLPLLVAALIGLVLAAGAAWHLMSPSAGRRR
jgi:hypothetical protein